MHTTGQLIYSRGEGVLESRHLFLDLQLLSKGCKVDIFDDEGHSPLHKAVMYGKLESVQVMAMNGVDLNIKDSLGNTSLHVRGTV